MSVPADRPEYTPSAIELRRAFDSGRDHLVGIEDEVMLLDPETLELAPRASDVLECLAGDVRFKAELPSSQLEIVTEPAETVSQAAAQLFEARQEAARRAQHLVRLAAAGVHPSSPAEGALNRLERYRHTIEEFGPVARRQLVCASQIHVSVRGAERALACTTGRGTTCRCWPHWRPTARSTRALTRDWRRSPVSGTRSLYAAAGDPRSSRSATGLTS